METAVLVDREDMRMAAEVLLGEDAVILPKTAEIPESIKTVVFDMEDLSEVGLLQEILLRREELKLILLTGFTRLGGKDLRDVLGERVLVMNKPASLLTVRELIRWLRRQ